MDDEYFSDEDLGIGRSAAPRPSVRNAPESSSQEFFSDADLGIGGGAASVSPSEGAASQHPGMAGTVAAGLRGAREYIPFARDIGAAATAPFRGVSFEEEKKRQEAMDAALAKEHPYAYTAGEIAGGVGSVLAPELAGLGLAGKASALEQAAASKIAPVLGSAAEAKLLTGLGSGAISGAAQEAIHGLGTGVGEERLEHAIEEAPLGLVGGAAGAGLGHLAARGARKVGELAGKVEKIAEPPSAAAIKKQSQEAYKRAADEGLVVGITPINRFYKNVISELEDAGYHKKLHKSMKPALDELKNASRPMTLENLEQVRRLTNSAAKNWNDPDSQRIAGIFRDKLDDFIEGLDVTKNEMWSKSGSPEKAESALKEARNLWKIKNKSDAIENMFHVAQGRADVSGIGGNYNNTLRQEARKLYEKARKQKRLWSADELQALKELYRGGLTQNLARQLGRFSPFHHTLAKYGLLGIGAGLGHGVGLGTAALGVGSHYLEDYLTKQAAQRAQRVVAGGGSRAAADVVNPMESAMARYYAAPAAAAPTEMLEEDRMERASGGKIEKRDYPAKRLTRMERAVKRAQEAIALETKPLMQKPDEQIAQALEIAKGR